VYSLLGQIHLVIIQLQYNYNTIWPLYLIILIAHGPEYLQTEQTNFRSSRSCLKVRIVPPLHKKRSPTQLCTELCRKLKKKIRLWLAVIHYHLTTMSEPSLEEQQKHLQQLLNSLKELIKNLPLSLPCERRKGPSENIFPTKLNMTKRKDHTSHLTRHMRGSFKGLQNLTGSCLSCEANTALSEYTPAWRYSQRYQA